VRSSAGEVDNRRSWAPGSCGLAWKFWKCSSARTLSVSKGNLSLPHNRVYGENGFTRSAHALARDCPSLFFCLPRMSAEMPLSAWRKIDFTPWYHLTAIQSTFAPKFVQSKKYVSFTRIYSFERKWC
jgi:hypothetical protein